MLLGSIRPCIAGVLAVLVLAVLVLAAPARVSAQAIAAPTPQAIDVLIPEYLGYYNQEGLKLDFLALGSATAIAAAFDNDRVDIAQSSVQLVLPLATKRLTVVLPPSYYQRPRRPVVSSQCFQWLRRPYCNFTRFFTINIIYIYL